MKTTLRGSLEIANAMQHAETLSRRYDAAAHLYLDLAEAMIEGPDERVLAAQEACIAWEVERYRDAPPSPASDDLGAAYDHATREHAAGVTAAIAHSMRVGHAELGESITDTWFGRGWNSIRKYGEPTEGA